MICTYSVCGVFPEGSIGGSESQVRSGQRAPDRAPALLEATLAAKI
jgi:hypothetical protein